MMRGMRLWSRELAAVAQEQSRALRLAILSALTLFVGFGVQHYVAYRSAAGAAILLAAGLSLGFIPALLRARGIRMAANAFLGVLFAALVAVSWVRGGATEAVLEWLMVIPLLAILFGSMRQAVAWTCICAGAYVSLLWTDASGWAPPDTPLTTFDYAIGRLTLLLAVGVICALLDRLRRARAEEMVRLERQIVESRKLESLGRLAGGIAHDFNNLLSVIVTRTDLALDPAADADSAREDLEAIRDAARQGTGLARELVAFGRRDPASRDLLDPNHLLEELERVVNRTLRSDVQLELRREPDVGPISADRDQMLQVLLNLCINAQDAMLQGGTITMSVHAQPFTEPRTLRTGTVPPGDYTTIAVSDTGIGMDERILSRMFEPFFTTKGRGRGSGLGLATVHAVVTQHDGYIDVESRLGHGTKISVHLPVAEPSVREQAATREEDPPALQRQHVLLVEDDPNVRAALQLLLVRAGHRVSVAADGRNALELLEKDAREADVVVTDVLMPGMSGRELGLEIRRRRPRTPIIYMSGHVDDVMADVDLAAEGAYFLRKPASRHELLEALDRTSRGIKG